MHITKHKVVSIDYRLTDDEGEVIDSSEGEEPLVYLHGVGAIVPGLEDELEGKQPGDAFSVSLEPEDAYGDYQEELCTQVAREHFDDVPDLEVGMQFRIPDDEGGEAYVLVTEIDEELVTLDGNHPLAGVNLHFQVSVVEVRDATPEEIEHGHAHGPGGHEH
ncbi:MAG: peptidylprolyl isomerase [Planctomycetales bacterium]|nr:peptidylprolyl isomerase [Planctomycetales bacterium]